MSTSFPNSIDTFTNPAPGDPLNNPDQAVLVSHLNDAVLQLQTKVGVNGSSFSGSLDYKINHIQNSGVTGITAGTGIGVNSSVATSPTITNTGVISVNAGVSGNVTVSVNNSDPHNPSITASYTGGGASGWPTFTGTANPNGVRASTTIGDTFADTTHGSLWMSTATGTASWYLIGGYYAGTTSITGVGIQAASVVIANGTAAQQALNIYDFSTHGINIDASSGTGPITLKSARGISFAAAANGFTIYTSTALGTLPVGPTAPAWGFTQDGNQYFYPVGGPWAIYGSGSGSGITALTSDVTASGAGSQIATLQSTANVNTVVGGLASVTAKAPLVSPAFTGTPSLPTGTTGVTQTTGDNSTKIATTAFVTTAVSGSGLFTTLSADVISTSTGGATTLQSTANVNTVVGGLASVSAKAPLASPAFTGTPSLPTGTTGVTQTTGDNSTKIATTAFVTTAVSGSGSGITALTGDVTASGSGSQAATVARINGAPIGSMAGVSATAGNTYVLTWSTSSGTAGQWVPAAPPSGGGGGGSTKSSIVVTAPIVTPYAINTDLYQYVRYAGITNTFTINTSGTPAEGDTLAIVIDMGTTLYAPTFSSIFQSSSTITLTAALAAMAINTRIDLGFIWNVTASQWRLVALA